MIRGFEDDEDGYRDWLDSMGLRTGYVGNAGRGRGSSFLRLHRNSCTWISDKSKGPFTTGDYVKVCASTRDEILEWARQHRPRFRHELYCKKCMPEITGTEPVEKGRRP